MEKSFKVSFTTNLGMFKFHEVNRDITTNVSQNRIKEIAKSMVEDGLKRVPIIVTSKFFIVDGQHRLEAAKIAGLGVWYQVDESIPNTPKGIFKAATILNRNSKVWSKKDYIHGYSAQGNESYTLLEDFSKKFPMFTITEQIMFLTNSGTNCVDKKKFGAGEFEVKSIKRAEQWAENVLSLKPFFEKGYNKSVFVRTILTIMEKKREFKFDEFLHKVQIRPTSLKLCGDKRSYSELIEDIYNYKRRENEKLNLRIQ